MKRARPATNPKENHWIIMNRTALSAEGIDSGYAVKLYIVFVQQFKKGCY